MASIPARSNVRRWSCAEPARFDSNPAFIRLQAPAEPLTFRGNPAFGA